MIPYKQIGDNLTVNEFNGVISLLRDNTKLNENIQINTSTVKGNYGEYVFDFQEATVLDNGILITNETLSTIGTVKLTKAVFPHSNYFLDLKIYSSEDVGISDMEHSDYIITELTIPLRSDMAVNIPFETLEMNNIIDFDATIRINHKDLVIKGTSHINLSADKSQAGWDEQVLFTARYVDDDNVPIRDAVINFYEGETLLGYDTTDEEGYASITHSFNTISNHTIFATYESITSNNVNINVTKHTLTLNLSANTNSAFVGMNINVTGSLKDGANGIIGQDVELYDGQTLLATLTTGNDGSFSTSVTMPSADMSLIAMYDDTTGLYNDATSQNVPITKVTEYTEVTFNGTTFQSPVSAQSPNFYGTNVIIDYGDGTVNVSNNYNHTYSTSGEHIIKIYNAEGINAYCFENVNISSIKLSNDVKSIGIYAFTGCSNLSNVELGSVESIGYYSFFNCIFESINIPNSVVLMNGASFTRNNSVPLKEIVLNWDSVTLPLEYNSYWIDYITGFEHFLIPQGTTSVYVAKGYPSNLLVEDSQYADIVGSAEKSILSYEDREKTNLYAQLVDSQGNPVSVAGVEITFKLGDEVLGSSETMSNGKATLLNGYTSTGAGDVTITVTDGISLTKTFVVHDYLFVPKLDGTDSKYQIIGTTTISNGEMSGGSGYLSTAWNNSNDWVLTCDFKFDNNNCALLLIKPNETSRDKNEIMVRNTNCYSYVNGVSSTIGSLSLSANNYYNVEITKQSSTITIKVNNQTITTSWTLASTLESMCIGVDTWANTATIKNIIVKPL